MDSAGNAPNVIVVMGVSGAGKTTVGRALADALAWPFHEADDYHSSDNVRTMARGEALSDDERGPWLAALHSLILGIVIRGAHAVLACSALKHSYRQTLIGDASPKAVRFVFLDVPRDTLEARLRARVGHFASQELLPSQLATLELPRSAVRVDGTLPVHEIVRRIRDTLEV
jgi:gluconokinase